MKQCCNTCYYSRANDETSVTCCRYPPEITKVEGNSITTYFPLLKKEAWCGEWRKRAKHTGVTEMVRTIQVRKS